MKKEIIERKNICITINSLGRGGAEKQCILLAQALHPFHNVTLVILDPREVSTPRLSMLKKENLGYEFLSKNSLVRFYQLIRIFRKQRVDFIFSFLPTDTVLSAICGRIAGVKYIFGGIRSSFIPKLKFKVLRTAHNSLLDFTIANNYAAHGSSTSLGFNENVFVIPNGIEIRPLESKKNKDELNIVSLGRLVDAKCYDVAIKTIKCLKELTNNSYKIKYKIVGQGPKEKDITAMINDLGLNEEIELITDAIDMYSILDRSDIYLCTSSFEGISNALMEAMNCALPLVVTDVGDNSKLVLNKKNGFTCPVNDYEALAQHLYKLIESPELRTEMGANSYTHLSANFSYKSFQEKYLKIISNIDCIKVENGEFKIVP